MNDALVGHSDRTGQVRSILFGLCIALPWLSPFTGGPSPGVPPMLVTLACAGLMLLLWTPALRGGSGQILAPTAAWSWLAAAGISGALGLLQYGGLALHGHSGISAAEAGVAYANLRQRNQLASLLSIGVVSLAYLAGTTGLNGIRRLGVRWAWALLVLLVAGHAATASRTGALQLVLLCAALFAWRPAGDWLLRWLSLSLLPLYLAWSWLLPRMFGPSSGAVLPDVISRIEAASVDCSSRLTLWDNVLQLIRLRPWVGWGWGELDYAHFITPYEGPRFCEILDNAHNLPLQLAVELGIPLALLACVVFTWWISRQKPWRETNPDRQAAWLVLGVIGVHSLLEYPLWYGPFQAAVVLCLMLLRRGAGIPRPSPTIKRNARICIAVFILACTGYAAWDYHRVSQLYLPMPERDPAYRSDTFAKASGSWLFSQQVRFAQLTTTQVTTANAMQLHAIAHETLHFSPEPRVVEKLIESADMLGMQEEVDFYNERYSAAYADDYFRWKSR